MIEDIIDASGIAPVIEDLLPGGVRGRQLSARTLQLQNVRSRCALLTTFRGRS